MSDQAVRTRVNTLHADLIKVKLDLADANIQIDELRDRFDEKHGIKLIDWFYRLLEHEPGLEMPEKWRLASSIVSVLFHQIGDDLLKINPEEFNITVDRSCMNITRKGSVVIPGSKSFHLLASLRAGLEDLARLGGEGGS